MKHRITYTGTHFILYTIIFITLTIFTLSLSFNLNTPRSVHDEWDRLTVEQQFQVMDSRLVRPSQDINREEVKDMDKYLIER